MAEVEIMTKKLGLAEKEAKVFINLFENGPETVREISERAGVARTHIYIILRKLIGLGLVFEVKEDRTSVYKALDREGLAGLAAKMASDWQSIRSQIADKYGLAGLFADFGADVSVSILNRREMIRFFESIKASNRKEVRGGVAVNLEKTGVLSRMMEGVETVRRASSGMLKGAAVIWPGGALFIDEDYGCLLKSAAVGRMLAAWAEAAPAGK